VKDPVPNDSNSQITEYGAANPDIFHVEKKFPKAEKCLVRRLGIAAWKRRQYLMSLRKWDYHSGPSNQNNLMDNVSLSEHYISSQAIRDSQERAIPPKTSLSSTISHIQDHLGSSTNAESSKETGVTSFTGAGQSIGQSALSERSSQDPPRLFLPLPPTPNRDFSGNIFECPYCQMLLANIVTRKTWK
jgi:hypothetical protein